MPVVTLSRFAESDLNSIAHYTQKHWGGRQAEEYISALFWTIREAAQSRAHFAMTTVGSVKFERVLCGKHHIYLQRSSREVFISRVLHGAMDVSLQILPRMNDDLA